jgi:hypothetical protein
MENTLRPCVFAGISSIPSWLEGEAGRYFEAKIVSFGDEEKLWEVDSTCKRG